MTATYKALVCTGIGQSEVQDLPVPAVREGYVLVRARAVALNPTDWKTIYSEDGQGVGTKSGCDFAGVVEEVGPGVTKFAKGDRICGMAFGGKDLEHGAFGEYVLTPAEPATTKIPANLSFEEAATLGVGIVTVGQGLYQSLQLPLPGSGEPPSAAPGTAILINGGSTTTGILGIQFARASGLTVYTTCSPHNAAYVASLGADRVYDYHEAPEALGARVRADSGGALALAWDCSPTPESARLAALALGGGGGGDGVEARYGVLLGTDEELVRALNPSVEEVRLTLGYTVFGERFARGGKVWEASREDWEFGRMFWALAGEMLGQGKVKVARLEADRGGKGLEGVKSGLEELRAGKVSALKLVYTF